jgi:hypothetical protein
MFEIWQDLKLSFNQFINLVHNYINLISREPQITDFDRLLVPAYYAEKNIFYKYFQTKLRADKVPQFEKKLPGSLWAITSFFNPSGYNNKYTNFKFFRESSKKQGLKLIVVELTFNSDHFEIQDEDAEKVIRIKGSDENIMWQKEALLNIGIKHLPDECDKVAWLDSDIIFYNDNWIINSSKLLEKYNVIQGFSTAINLKKNSYSTQKNLCFDKEKIMRSIHSLGRGLSYFGKEELEKDLNTNLCGISGYAWIIRREILEKSEGFFDQMILGGGDLMMVYAFYGYPWKKLDCILPTKVLQNAERWSRNMSKLTNASVYFCPGIIFHLWHGKTENRNYLNRWNAFLDFDPNKDIIKSPEGIYSWSPGKEIEQETAKSYFNSRKEETE